MIFRHYQHHKILLTLHVIKILKTPFFNFSSSTRITIQSLQTQSFTYMKSNFKFSISHQNTTKYQNSIFGMKIYLCKVLNIFMTYIIPKLVYKSYFILCLPIMRENLLMNKNGPNQDFGPLYLFNQDQQTDRNSTFVYQFGYDKYD